MIRLAAPDIDDDDVAAVTGALRSGYLVQGRHVAEFERLVAETCRVPSAVAVNSGTSALHLALLAIGIGPGDLVAVAPYSWPATANVVELCGARPVFVDITPDTWTMDPARLSEAFVGHPRLRAIIPVDAFGGMADMQSICGSAAERGVPVVEDAACALGASLHGRMAGSWGQLGCLSFHPRKAVTTGEGGAVTGDDAPEIHTVRRLRNHGQDLSSGAPDFRAAGFNMRLTEFQAALGVAQLKKLERLLTARIDRAQRYDQLLHEVPVTRPFALPGSRHVYQSYVVLLPPDSAARRDSIIRSMRAQDVEVQIGTHHIPGLTYYRRKYPGPETCAVSADVAARAIALPLHAGLSADDQERVVRALRSQL